MRSLKSTLLISGYLIVVMSGCAPDASHDNPLDPSSPNYNSNGDLSGRVLTVGLPYSGVAGALVLIEQTGAAQTTASDGTFSFSTTPSGSLTLVISKGAYLSDTVRVSVPVGGKDSIDVYMDALPQISNTAVITTKIDQWWPGPVYSATVSATVVDRDGSADIDSVYAQVVYSQVDTLTFGMSLPDKSNISRVSIDASLLPNQDLQGLIGKEIDVFAIDKSNGIGRSAPAYVTRLIEEEPTPTVKSTPDTLTSMPTFEWDPPSVSFSYTYQLQVFVIKGGIPQFVWSQSGVSSSNVSYQYNGTPLDSATYFWTAAIVDQFGNSSRSKEAPFVVQ